MRLPGVLRISEHERVSQPDRLCSLRWRAETLNWACWCFEEGSKATEASEIERTNMGSNGVWQEAGACPQEVALVKGGPASIAVPSDTARASLMMPVFDDNAPHWRV